ncbi:ATP-binding protein [Candidatus Microgenomates bacterium]|nr:ATP-binding protein [Candidatus Microgenomates bacterium]
MIFPFSKKKKKIQQISLSASKKAIRTLKKGMIKVVDLIAPSAVEVDFDHLKIDSKYYRTLFVATYPRFVSANWLYPVISFDHSLIISMFVYPQEAKIILDDLRRKIAEMEATIQSDLKRGKVIDPSVQVALDDALSLQAQLAKGAERFFQFGLYITIPADSLEELNRISKQVEATLGSLLIISKHSTLQMEEGLKTCLPFGKDFLAIKRNMDTTSLATTFPFSTASLTANEGVLYGLNEHDGSLVIFDRFTLENANSVVFGKSGGGKSFLVKLETLRSLMFGAEVFIIDPEGEYPALSEALGGEFVEFSFSSPVKINPFDLSGMREEGENELGLKILSLHSLMKVIMGELSPSENAVLDRALVQTYKQKGITPDPETQNREPPLMEDLYKVLIGMEDSEAKGLAERLEKFIKGSLAGIFNQKSNLDIKNPFTVFCIRDLEAELRPIAMFIILDFIWTRIKRERKKRILVVDEAWYLMKHPDSANFLYSIAKRARKYYLGLTTITQDVEDFLESEHGKPIITNSSMQILLKQSPAAIDKIAEVFYLSGGEKHFLLSCEIGEGLFFAGPSHVALRVVASPDEYDLITTKPEEVLARQGPKTPAEEREIKETERLTDRRMTSQEKTSKSEPPPRWQAEVQTEAMTPRTVTSDSRVPDGEGISKQDSPSMETTEKPKPSPSSQKLPDPVSFSVPGS